MARYRTKPVVIEAFELGKDIVPDWFNDAVEAGTVWYHGSKENLYYYTIETLDGDHRANPGDFIIQGIKGELYPCKADIFDKTYEYVGSEEA